MDTIVAELIGRILENDITHNVAVISANYWKRSPHLVSLHNGNNEAQTGIVVKG